MPKKEILQKIQIVLCLSIVAFLAIGCPSDGSSGNNDDDDDVESLAVVGSSGELVELDGTWETECYFNLNAGAHVKSVSTYSGSSITTTNYAWFDSEDCSEPFDNSIAGDGNFTILRGPVTDPDIATADFATVVSALVEEFGIGTANKDGEEVDATKLIFRVVSASATVNNPILISEYNENGVCGWFNWLFGVEVDILGTSCWPDSTLKDIIYIDDETLDEILRLYNGDPDPDARGQDGFPLLFTDAEAGFERQTF